MASILDIIFDAPYANGEQMQLASIQLDKSLGKCGVKATWQGNLLNISLLLASYDFGPLFGDAEEGVTGPWAATEGTSPVGPILSSHDALNPGPLADNLAKTFSGGRYNTCNSKRIQRSTAQGPLMSRFVSSTLQPRRRARFKHELTAP